MAHIVLHGDIAAQIARIEQMEAEAIDRFHTRIIALRRDKAALREELERTAHRAAIVRRIENPMRKERFRNA